MDEDKEYDLEVRKVVAMEKLAEANDRLANTIEGLKSLNSNVLEVAVRRFDDKLGIEKD